MPIYGIRLSVGIWDALQFLRVPFHQQMYLAVRRAMIHAQLWQMTSGNKVHAQRHNTEKINRHLQLDANKKLPNAVATIAKAHPKSICKICQNRLQNVM